MKKSLRSIILALKANIDFGSDIFHFFIWKESSYNSFLSKAYNLIY